MSAVSKSTGRLWSLCSALKVRPTGIISRNTDLVRQSKIIYIMFICLVVNTEYMSQLYWTCVSRGVWVDRISYQMTAPTNSPETNTVAVFTIAVLFSVTGER